MDAAPLKLNLVIADHPLLQDRLTRMRRRETATPEFRQAMREAGRLLGVEATRGLALERTPIETPVAAMSAPALVDPAPVIVSILRAGDGLAAGLLDLLPEAGVGQIGLRRDPKTLAVDEYCFKIPADIGRRFVIVADPMLATGHSAVAALDRLKLAGAERIVFVCLLAAPEGIAALQSQHPDVLLVVGAIDARLNDHAYIVPGLGDAGDRLNGTV